MIVMKKAISRRTILRGLGATIGLPLLDAMVPAMTALAQTPATNGCRRVWGRTSSSRLLSPVSRRLKTSWSW